MDESTSTPGLTLTGKIVSALAILSAGAGISKALKDLGPKPEAVPQRIAAQEVEVSRVKRTAVPLSIASQGILEPATETLATAEVAGRVVWVSPAFEAGGTFRSGDELLRTEDADYRAAVASAEASLRDAELAVKMEEAKAAQATRDWQKLESGKPGSDLVTREPHLVAARARASAASAALDKAKLDLVRTTLRAPYTGRLRATRVDIGAHVAPGTPLAEFYSTESYEVRLAVTVDDLAAMDLNAQPEVRLETDAAGVHHEWKGKIVRTEGEVDRTSRSVNAVARLEPGETANPLLMPGLFMRATITGRVLENVMRLPRLALYGDSRVVTVSPENKLGFRDVKIARAERDTVLISDGLKDGDLVLGTVLPVVVEGALVSPVREDGQAIPASPTTPAAPAGKS